MHGIIPFFHTIYIWRSLINTAKKELELIHNIDFRAKNMKGAIFSPPPKSFLTANLIQESFVDGFTRPWALIGRQILLADQKYLCPTIMS